MIYEGADVRNRVVDNGVVGKQEAEYNMSPLEAHIGPRRNTSQRFKVTPLGEKKVARANNDLSEGKCNQPTSQNNEEGTLTSKPTQTSQTTDGEHEKRLFNSKVT